MEGAASWLEMPPPPTPPSPPSPMSPLEQNSEELPDAGTAEDTGHDWRREKEEIDAFKREARLHAQRRLAERDSLVDEDDSPGTGDSPGNSPNPAHAYDEERRARRAAALSRAKLSKYGETLGSGKQGAASPRLGQARGGVALWSPRRGGGSAPGSPRFDPRQHLAIYTGMDAEPPLPPQQQQPGRGRSKAAKGPNGTTIPEPFAAADPERRFAFMKASSRPSTASTSARPGSAGGQSIGALYGLGGAGWSAGAHAHGDDLVGMELRRAAAGEDAPATRLMPYMPRGDGRSDVPMTSVLRQKMSLPLHKLRQTLAQPTRPHGRRPLSLRPERPGSSATRGGGGAGSSRGRGSGSTSPRILTRPSTAASATGGQLHRPSSAASGAASDWEVADFGSGRSLAPKIEPPKPRPGSARAGASSSSGGGVSRPASARPSSAAPSTARPAAFDQQQQQQQRPATANAAAAGGGGGGGSAEPAAPSAADIAASLRASAGQPAARPSSGLDPAAGSSRSLGASQVRAILLREDLLEQVTALLHAVRRVRGGAKRLAGRICCLYQWRLAKILDALRRATLDVVEAAEAWRSAGDATGLRLMRVDGELRTVPEPIVFNGENYLLKILTDLTSLPLPGASDPFLLRWFGKEADWWHAAYGKVCPPSALRDGSRQGAHPPFPLDLLAPTPAGELDPHFELAMSKAEQVLKAVRCLSVVARGFERGCRAQSPQIPWPPLLLATAHAGHHCYWPPRMLATTVTGHRAYWPPHILASTHTGLHSYRPPLVLASTLTGHRAY